LFVSLCDVGLVSVYEKLTPYRGYFELITRGVLI
jgi:hypothetical protein